MVIFDLCWMDCDEPGELKRRGELCICLCRQHALLLERGAWRGDYTGAPLPPESMATAWPWRRCAEVEGVYVPG